MTEIAKNVDHPNVHFVFEGQFITLRTGEPRDDMFDDDERFDDFDLPVNLINSLPASKVKTITYPGKAYRQSKENLPVPETTFMCDKHLAKNFNKFIAGAKVRFNF